MMPCKLCTKYDAEGLPLEHLKGLKQRGKTKSVGNSTIRRRHYACQDCGAKFFLEFDPLCALPTREGPILHSV